MALPKIVTPEFDTKIPSTQEEIRYRPFLVKEEKILFMAMESRDQKAVAQAMMNVLRNCIIAPLEMNLTKLAAYDVEYLFLQLRAKSVGENITLSVHHPGWDDEDQPDICKFATEVSIPIDAITVKGELKQDDPIMLTDTLGLKLRHPNMMDMSNLTAGPDETPNMDEVLKMVGMLIYQVFDAESVYDDFTADEMSEFLESLNQAQFEKLMDQFQKIPGLKHDIEWTCPSCGATDTQTLEGISAFFT
jgi:hypothetical protein